MSRIELCEDSAFAPCCFIIARERGDGVFDARDEANTFLVQQDWDWPGIAQTFGWNPLSVQAADAEPEECNHFGTDGTVDCPHCGVKAADFITAAGEWLHANVGAVADDPGYFEED